MTDNNLHSITKLHNEGATLEQINEKYLSFVADVPEEEQINVWKSVCGFANPSMIDYLLSLGWRSPGTEDQDGNSLLHLLATPVRNATYAVLDDNIYTCTQKLLAAKVSPLRKNKNGETAIMLAAELGYAKMLQAYTEANAKIDFLDRNGNTLLHIIAQYSSQAIFQLTSAVENLVNFKNSRSNNPESPMYAQRIAELEAKQHQKKARFGEYIHFAILGLAVGLDPTVKNNERESAIDVAIRYKSKAVGAILNGADATDENSFPMYMAAGGMNLHQACINKDIEAVNALIELGTNLNEAYDKEDDRYNGMTPLTIAMIMHSVEITEALLKHGADAKLLDSKSWHPFRYLYATYSGMNTNSDEFKNKIFHKILKAYLDAGFEIDSLLDDDENTLLILSAKSSELLQLYNGESIATVLIDELIYSGAEVNKTNREGVSALMYICQTDARRGEKNLLTLLEQGASTELRDINGKTTLMYAVTNSNHTVAQTYCELLAEFGNLLINEADNNQKTALDYAAEKNYESLVAWLVGKM